MAKHFDIESPEEQAVAEEADDKALIDRAMKRDLPGEWLTKACRVGGVSKPRQERLRSMLALRVEQFDMATVEGGLSQGCFTVSQA